MDVPAGHPEKPAGEDGLKLLARMNGGHHEDLSLWGLSFLPVNATDKLLDIGCGGGANIERLLERAPEGHVTGVDYSPTSVQASREYNARAIEAGQCEILEGNASDLPLADACIDAATAFETTYYWDLPSAFAEVKRVLKPGGRFLVCNEDDGDDPEVLELATKIPTMVVYSPAELERALVQAGFEIERSEHVGGKGHLAIVAQAPR